MKLHAHPMRVTITLLIIMVPSIISAQVFTPEDVAKRQILVMMKDNVITLEEGKTEVLVNDVRIPNDFRQLLTETNIRRLDSYSAHLEGIIF